ncbi:MAG: phenylalanine--tRNA ligase subunit alpha [Bdellovibrionota bacterium]
MLKEKIEAIRAQAASAFQAAPTAKELYESKVQFLGKQGSLSGLMKEMGKLSVEEKPLFGKLVNEVKQALEAIYDARETELKGQELSAKLQSESIDLTLPASGYPPGARHPISIVIEEISAILARLGYAVRTGPLIERDRYNFEALNIPKDHPARDMQDTFYVDQTHVLRTHTSPIQVHVMETEKPPLRVIGVGPVFRADSDISHSPNFHQIEGLCVDRKVSMADLKGTITFFVREYFGKDLKTRFRPSFFPFTEPSAEVDCQCPICTGKGCRMCKDSGWIEIGGSGLVHPNVLKSAGVQYPEWQGFAFGFGIERMAIIKYGIDDIRLFNENDVRFLRQFSL